MSKDECESFYSKILDESSHLVSRQQKALEATILYNDSKHKIHALPYKARPTNTFWSPLHMYDYHPKICVSKIGL
jgi:hypothetical protein